MGDNIIRNIFTYLLIALTGMLSGLLIASYLEGTVTVTIVVLLMLVLMVLGYSALRRYVSKQRRIFSEGEDRGEETEVGFVVDTFHELVSKLKEKEKELAELKSRAEERAGRIEAYNENILQSIPSGVVSIDNDMKIRSINHSAERILGTRLIDAIGRDFRGIFGGPLISILEEHRTITRAEYPYTTKDGRTIWLGVTTSQLRNKQGDIIGTLFIFTDLTDIKALQEEVKLRERLSQLGEMSAGIAHELRNSMSVISGYAKLLSRNIDADSTSSVESILAEIKSMDRIISELLSFAKPTILNKTTIDLNRLIEETAMAVAGCRDSINLFINAGDKVFIEADETLLRQALTNLLINAVEAMPEGGMLDVEIQSHGDMAIIKIKDTGKGISDDVRARIFLPFFTTKEKGFGLGLALVQKIIVAHNGRVEFESKDGEGSTFKVSIPLIASNKPSGFSQ